MGAEISFPLGSFFETAGWGDGFSPARLVMHTSRAAHLHGLIDNLLPHHGDVQAFLRGDQMVMIVCALVYDKGAMPGAQHQNRTSALIGHRNIRRANAWLSCFVLTLTGYGTVMYT